MLISLAGIELIKHFESLRLTAYLDSGGVLTIGWGHVHDVVQGQAVTQQQADALLVDDLRNASAAVTAALGHAPTSQGQFDAFTSFAFNEGASAFAGSTMLKRFLSGQECKDEFLRWVLDDTKVLPGLVIRRMAERQLFLGRAWQGII